MLDVISDMFQFYQVRFKHFLPLGYNLACLFQFYQVRFKLPDFLMFQLFDLCFNSIKCDLNVDWGRLSPAYKTVSILSSAI